MFPQPWPDQSATAARKTGIQRGAQETNVLRPRVFLLLWRRRRRKTFIDVYIRSDRFFFFCFVKPFRARLASRENVACTVREIFMV